MKNPYSIRVTKSSNYKKFRDLYSIIMIIDEPPSILANEDGFRDALTEGKGNVISIPITKKCYEFLKSKGFEID